MATTTTVGRKGKASTKRSTLTRFLPRVVGMRTLSTLLASFTVIRVVRPLSERRKTAVVVIKESDETEIREWLRSQVMQGDSPESVKDVLFKLWKDLSNG